jgi:hypothetical protein
MRARVIFAGLAIAALLALGLALGCQEARSDTQVAADVQAKLKGDPAVQSRQYTVAANKGVVTIDGTVASESERAAAAGDAAQIQGVKTVVNNLQVAPPVVAQQPPQAAPPPPPVPAAEPRERKPKPPAHQSVRKSQPQDIAPFTQPDNTMAMNQPAMPPAVAPPPPPPPPPPKPVDVTIPSGTTLSIRLIDPIDSEHNQVGDRFRATLNSPITVGDRIVIPSGADVTGQVADVKNAAHFKGASSLALVLTRVTVNGKSYDLQTDQFSRQGTGRGKNTAEKVGGGALLGALIGGLAGGGKGAAIGAGVGGGAGGTVQGVTRGQQIRLTSEQVLTFHLQNPLTVTPAPRVNRNEGRQKLDEQ